MCWPQTCKTIKNELYLIKITEVTSNHFKQSHEWRNRHEIHDLLLSLYYWVLRKQQSNGEFNHLIAARPVRHKCHHLQKHGRVHQVCDHVQQRTKRSSMSSPRVLINDWREEDKDETKAADLCFEESFHYRELSTVCKRLNHEGSLSRFSWKTQQTTSKHKAAFYQ